MKAQQLTLSEYLEDAEAIEAVDYQPEQVLADDELRRRGMVPVKAYVRTRQSKAAARSQRSRQKAEAGENGPPRKQISIMAPADDESRKILKLIAERLLSGELSAQELAGDQVSGYGHKVLALIERGGLRGWLLKRLIEQA